jgi:protein-arginine kinase activator protein McsA
MGEMSECQHYMMYLERGRLTCAECGQDCTPPLGHRITVVQSGYRDNITESLKEIANQVPDEVLHEIEVYAEYLAQRHSKSEDFAKVIEMVGNSSGQHRGKKLKK